MVRQQTKRIARAGKIGWFLPGWLLPLISLFILFKIYPDGSQAQTQAARANLLGFLVVIILNIIYRVILN